MSDTPRTDEAYREINRKLQGQWCSHSPTEQTAWDIARQLERELAEAKRNVYLSDQQEKAQRLIDECAPYLKEGETPAERIKRDFLDCQAVTALLAKERQRAQNAEGMAECMRMVRDELVEAGIIDAGVAPMFIPEAVAGKLAEARRLLSDIRADAQCAHWHKDIDAAMKAE